MSTGEEYLQACSVHPWGTDWDDQGDGNDGSHSPIHEIFSTKENPHLEDIATYEPSSTSYKRPQRPQAWGDQYPESPSREPASVQSRDVTVAMKVALMGLAKGNSGNFSSSRLRTTQITG